jgi:hypothetical protein
MGDGWLYGHREEHVPFSEINCEPTIDMLYLKEQLERGRLRLM